VAPVSSSTVPSATPTPTCWSACFEKAGITDESQLCGNTEVDKCIHDTCCKEEDEAYWSWYDSYCPSPSSSVPVSPVSSSAIPYGSGSSSWAAAVSSSVPSYPAGSSAAAVSSAPYYGASSWEVTSTSVVSGTSTVYITNVSQQYRVFVNSYSS
jgi:hypothetical protein